MTLSACVARPGAASGQPTALSVDRSINPGDDFYLYANKPWIDSHTLSADRSTIGRDDMAFQRTSDTINKLLESILVSDAPAASAEGRIRDFYTAFADTATIDASGLAPLRGDLARINSIATVSDLSRALGQQVTNDVDPLNVTDFGTDNLFGVMITRSLANDEVMPYLLQGGLGFPLPGSFLPASPGYEGWRAMYLPYIQDMLKAGGYTDANAMAERVFALESKIAQAHAPGEEFDDIKEANNVWGQGDFRSRAPGIDWDEFFAAAQLDRQPNFIAYQPSAIPRLSALVAREPIAVWKEWLVYHLLNANAYVLPKPFRDANFDFVGRKFLGRIEPQPRAAMALYAANEAVGEEIGKLYVERSFTPESKAQIKVMVANIKDALVRRLAKVEWMTPQTRAEASRKLQAMEVGIGYPDKWGDHAGTVFTRNNAYENRKTALHAAYRRQLAKLGKPMDPSEWWMNPQVLNAVNLPVQNAMNFPAAQLQPPYFYPGGDAAYNYGSIGAIIGHEISHGFDAMGAAFDARGYLRDWWTKKDLENFAKASDALVAQYDAYEPLPGARVNGRLTLNENIADLAGLTAAYDAYHASLGGRADTVIDGLTGDQRFFIAFAQHWAGVVTDEMARGLIATNVHAFGPVRALTVRNIDAWYRAFDVKPGDEMYLPPEKRVRIW